jgi:lipopolysaccharide export system ATP-binding protein
VKPQTGRVLLDDTDVTKWPMYRRARAGVGYLPQEASVFRRLTVEDNLKLVLELHGVRGKEQKAQIEELLSELHMIDRRKSIGATLSGGERRRVEIARALATHPKFILLDEPFTGIDPRTIEELQEIIHALRDRGIGILITDHNVGATLNITDWNYILVAGKIVAEGDRRKIVADPDVRKFYLGDRFED